MISGELRRLFPDVSIVSEEGANREVVGEQFWLVDPLDGTKSFIKRSDEFTVNIGLIDGDTPVWGVVYVPAQERLYFVDSTGKAKCCHADDDDGIAIDVRTAPEEGLTVVASKSHLNAETKALY